MLRYGIGALLSGIRSLNFHHVDIPIDATNEDICHHRPSIVITDPLTMSIKDIENLKNQCRTAVFAIGTSALPEEYIKAVDGVIGLYDTAAKIAKLLKLQLRSLESADSELTPREQEIVIGVVKGMSNKEIAADMNLAVNTVMTHRRNIAAKLQIHSAAGLTIYALMNKLVALEDVAN